MAFPKGLHFRNRRAELEGEAFFDCVRSGHAPGQRRVRRSFNSHRDRETYVTRHDAKYHDELLAAKLGITRAPSLGETIGDFLQHFGKLVNEKKRDPKTFLYYKGICDKLIEHFGSDCPIDTIGRKAMLHFAEAEKKAGSTSGGDRFVKAAKVLKRLQRFAELTVIWETPIGDLSPVHRERESIPIEDIRDFLGAMSSASLEYAFAATKFITMLRNEELYAAKCADVRLKDDGTGELDYYLRNKQTGQKLRHVTYLPASLVRVLSPMIAKRKGSDALFMIGKRPLGPWSLRKRFLAASARATESRRKRDPNAKAVTITAVGQFRHEASTIAQDHLESTFPVSEHLHHADERTTRKHYKLRKRDQALKQSKKVTEVTASKLIH